MGVRGVRRAMGVRGGALEVKGAKDPWDPRDQGSQGSHGS